MINRVVLVGRLTKEPELKYTQSGVAVCRFTLAVNRTFTNAKGEREADFVNCVSWRKQAENMANFLKKGSLAGIDGRIQTSNFEGKDGNRVFMTEVVADSVQFLDTRSSADKQQEGAQQTNGKQYAPKGSPDASSKPDNSYYSAPGTPGNFEVNDDDLPF